jgi:tRNA dimethylallyltransferase
MSGGTAFYMKNFVCGLPAAPPSDRAVRAGLVEEAAVRGLAALYGELARVDPTYAATIGGNDRSRILRALEVHRATGRPLSSYRVPACARSDYRCLLIGLERPRAELDARIERRVDAMFEAGLAREVAGLRAMGYGPGDPGMKAIGYREFFECGGDAEAARALIKRHTRQYARRQTTFFRSLEAVTWLHADDTGRLAELAAAFLRGA